MRRRGCNTGPCCGGAPVGCLPCIPCTIPTEDLKISINGGALSTLIYSSGSNRWSDSTYSLSCTPCAFTTMTLTGNSETWTLSSTVCDPVSYTFSGSLGDIAVITDPGTSVICPPGYTHCVSCLGPIIGSFKIDDANGSHTATYNSTLGLWVTPQLCASVLTVVCCIGGVAQFVNGTNCGLPVLYVYAIACTSANHITVSRFWYELNPGISFYTPCNCATGAGVQAYSSSGSQLIDCSSPAWSGTLTKITGNLADPVGGTVSISASSAGPVFGPPSCCQIFTIRGCNSVNLPGVIVNIYDTLGGTLLATGTTNSSGSPLPLYWFYGCTVYVVIIDPTARFTSYGSTLTLITGNTTVVTLSVASGYTCISVCGFPLAHVIHCTFSGAGTVDFTYNASIFKWETANPFTYASVDYYLTYSVAGAMTGTASPGGAFTISSTRTGCPITDPYSATVTVPSSGVGSPLGNGVMTEGP